MIKKLGSALALALLILAGTPFISAPGTSQNLAFAQQKEELVVFNTKTLKFHSRGCKWAIKCTKSCITISRAEAIKRGGIPCKVCGAR